MALQEAYVGMLVPAIGAHKGDFLRAVALARVRGRRHAGPLVT